ncbi:hypothetical protein FRC07_003806 [Ceratobasidium sp. 392]|nr:hypothetical protein FRC07_003806 [Ceratobasidium sp. 392]
MDIHAGDPQAPIVSRHDLPTFRRSFPQVTQIMVELSAELENSVKTYKHRRSPSPSVVIKLRAMLKTLAVWNDYLRDSTFAEPTKTIQTWLENHPDQVNSALRQRAPSSGQPSPVASERRPSPGQYDAPLFTPTGAEMYSSSQSQFVSGHGHNRGDTVSPRTTSFLPPTMTYEQPMFANGNSGPTFYPQARAAARGSAPGSHVFPQNEPGIFDIDFASMGMYDHMGGPNYQGR